MNSLTNVPMPNGSSSAPTRFSALVQKCEQEGSRNPILAAAARDPKLYREYRHSFAQPGTAVLKPNQSPSHNAQQFQNELTKLCASMERGEAIVQLSKTRKDLFNSAKREGLI